MSFLGRHILFFIRINNRYFKTMYVTACVYDAQDPPDPSDHVSSLRGGTAAHPS